ncbi:MAG: circadian clock KaiB family protein [Pseudobdellovibrionaceae bacterium]
MAAERKKQNGKGELELWHFVLYLSGEKTRLSRKAITNLYEICEEYLNGRYSIQIIDIEDYPKIGKDKNIIASPTLIRELPEPVKRVIGDLSEREKALLALAIKKKPL